MNSYKNMAGSSILRTTDGAFIPADNANTDYQLYLKEAAAGATVLPTDPINPNDAINAQITILEANPPVPRLVRESLLRIAEKDAARDATPTNTAAMILAADFGYQRIRARDNQIAALRAQLK